MSGLPLRDWTISSPSSTNAIALKPSYLGSYAHSSPVGNCARGRASWGSIGGFRGNVTAVRSFHHHRSRDDRRGGVSREPVLVVRGGPADDRREPGPGHAAVGPHRP